MRSRAGTALAIARADVGWGAVITAVVFAAGHAIAVDRSGALHVEPLLAVRPLVGSLLAGWARSRLGALAPLISGRSTCEVSAWTGVARERAGR